MRQHSAHATRHASTALVTNADRRARFVPTHRFVSDVLVVHLVLAQRRLLKYPQALATLLWSLSRNALELRPRHLIVATQAPAKCEQPDATHQESLHESPT